MYKYKYNKYNIKFMSLEQIGGMNEGCCSVNCGRNPKQIEVEKKNKLIKLMCCDLCLNSKGQHHTKKCNDYLRDDICNCGRIHQCGIIFNKGTKFEFCCEACELGNNNHTNECDKRQIEFAESLKKNSLEDLQKNQEEKLDTPKKEENQQPLKKILGEINAKMRNNLKESINDIEKIIKSYKMDKLEQIIARVLYESLNSKDNKMDGFNFFNKYFLELKFPITEQIAVNGLKLMNFIDIPLPVMLEFLERLSKEVKLERRLIAEFLKYCDKNKLKDYALVLIRFGIVNNVIFTKEDFGIMFSIFINTESINKDEIMEILNYMKAQDYKDPNFDQISQLNVQLLCSIFNCKIVNVIPYYTENTKQKIQNLEKKFFETKHQKTLNICNTNLPKFNFTTGEKNRIIKAITSKLGKFTQTIDEKIGNINVDYVVDGANVGYHFDNNGQTKIMMFKKINMIVSKLVGNIIIFLHSAHLNKIRRTKKQTSNIDIENNNILQSWISTPNIILIETPYNENDDYSWIYTTLKHEAMLISKDNMNDHYDKIFKHIVPVKFRLWQSLHQIYHETLTGDVVELLLPPICLKKIQNVGLKWIFPLNNNEWLCTDIDF